MGTDRRVERAFPSPYIEGAWMTAHQGKYYLQYAAPGTEWKSYADGVYVGTSPAGPFTYMENSPVSYKPTGFIGGAGHGCIFTAGSENYWKAATNSIPSGICLNAGYLSIRPALIKTAICLRTPI